MLKAVTFNSLADMPLGPLALLSKLQSISHTILITIKVFYGSWEDKTWWPSSTGTHFGLQHLVHYKLSMSVSSTSSSVSPCSIFINQSWNNAMLFTKVFDSSPEFFRFVSIYCHKKLVLALCSSKVTLFLINPYLDKSPNALSCLYNIILFLSRPINFLVSHGRFLLLGNACLGTQTFIIERNI